MRSKALSWDFPGSPVRTLCFQCKGCGFDPWLGNWDPCLPHWASLVAQMVENPPAMQETLVRFMGREDPLEKA